MGGVGVGACGLGDFVAYRPVCIYLCFRPVSYTHLTLPTKIGV